MTDVRHIKVSDRDAIRERLGVLNTQAVEAVRSLEPKVGHLLVPDVEGPWPPVLEDRHFDLLRVKMDLLRPLRPIPIGRLPRPRADWNSVALFFNLVPARQPSGYAETTADDARAWLDEGADPASPTISEFMQNYWGTLSYGHFSFGVDTARDDRGVPLIPTIDNDAEDWGGLIRKCLEANAEAVWRAAGSRTKEGRRWIPSLVLVQRYGAHASAFFGGWNQTVAGVDYDIGDSTHVQYELDFAVFNGVTTTVRGFWGTLAHEYGHNFLEFWDLYGPQGCTGYWDLLGCNSPPTRMSEVCSLFKARVGWLTWKQVIQGPTFPATDLSLRPYTTSGEAFKVVPDPDHTPREYFLLEFRASTGQEAWRPDAALGQRGLLITHINERVGVAGTWLLREAPFFDPEFANFSDSGAALWTGHDRLDGVLFPQPGNDSFTPSTTPNSNLYGDRPSGLSITSIRMDGETLRFTLEMTGNPRVGWTVSDQDRTMTGRFSAQAEPGGQEIFIRNGNAVALIVERQAQFLVEQRQDDWVGGWNLGDDNYEVIGDLDGDGTDEIYIRSPEWAGVLKWTGSGFDTVTVQNDWIGEWNLGKDNRELAADLDGDGADEILIRSPDWCGVLKLHNGQLTLRSLQHDWIDQWNLGTDNVEVAGRFTRPDRDDVLIRSPEWLGLLQWDDQARRLKLVSMQHDWVDGWNLGGADVQLAADLDGDGLDELYIRSPEWAGVMKWRDGRFQLLWLRQGSVEALDDNPDHRVALSPNDVSYRGSFLPDRDGLLHRGANGRLAVLTWEGTEMRLRHFLDSPLNGYWTMGPGDRYTLGAFQRTGPDIALPDSDFVADGISSAFIHNRSGTAAVGVNHLLWPDGSIVSQFGVTWIAGQDLMFGR